MRHIEVVTPGLGGKSGGPVGGDAIAKDAVDALEAAGLGELRRRIALDPLAVEEIAHDRTSLFGAVVL